MKTFKARTRVTEVCAFAVALSLASSAPNSRANVCATDIKLNGAMASIKTLPGRNVVNISYILNEPATAGVTINVLSGSNVIRAINLPAGNPGALRGTNLVVWDGNDSHTNAVPAGTYSIAVTPAATGYTNWTQISVDTNAGNYVYHPYGIAVDNNTNSPYYGRVLVGNSQTGPNSATVPGDKDGILKCNADGSFADEGGFGNGGYNVSDTGETAAPGEMVDDGYNDLPQKMRIGEDDRLYMNDWTGYGRVVAFDMAVTTNQTVLSSANYASNPFFDNSMATGWNSLDVTGAGTTNGLLWYGAYDSPNSAGIWIWHLTNGVANPADTTGTQAIGAGGSLTQSANGGIMVDTNYDIFAGQYGTAVGNQRCMVFTNWNKGSAWGGSAELTRTAWAAGGADGTFLNNYDLTINSRQHPVYAACAMVGPNAFGIRILNATNGSTIQTNLDWPNAYSITAWDNVGNLYAGSPSLHVWRVFSPPAGANQSTTIAVETIQVIASPSFTGLSDLNGTVTLNFTAASSDSPAAFTLQRAPSVAGPYADVPGAHATQNSPGLFSFSTTTNGATQFYRIRR
ncbi:MAG: hypothetical protein ABSH38_07910 [Verrucomicrobiota bacterium]